MSGRSRDEEREQRIAMEIVVDCYGPEEQAMGWYCYLEDQLEFPFLARCVNERAISPLRGGDELDVVGMAPEDECEHEMFVLTRWDRGTLAVPLSQLEGVGVSEQTRQAVEDWHYWAARYEL
jgi:Calcium binding